MEGTVVALCTAGETGGAKDAQDEVTLRRGHGIVGDAHAGNWHRQVSLLGQERIDEMRAKGLELAPGAFGENIVYQGFDLESLEIGRRIRLGDTAVLQVTQHGKECHTRCKIYYAAGECIMPTRGTFTRVIMGGTLRPGDRIATDPELDRYRYAVLTLSDRSAAGTRPDEAGPLAVRLLHEILGGTLVAQEVMPDSREQLEAALVRLCDEELCDLIVTTGGTGLSPRDVTPEATQAVIDREIPGMAEAMRAVGLKKTPHAMLSRAVCGQRGQTVIVNLSGSPKAVQEQLDALAPALPHSLEMATGIPQDCARGA
ncbi:MAG: molybdopterin-binding protein [bacterium]